MKFKFFLVLICLICLLITPVLSYSSDSSIDTKNFHGRSFSVDYPSEWQSMDVFQYMNFPKDGTIIEAVAFGTSANSNTLLMIFSYPKLNSFIFGKTDADKVIQAAGILAGTSSPQYLGRDMVGGINAYKYHLTMSGISDTVSICDKGNKYYLIQEMTPLSSHYDFLKMKNSLKLF